MYHINSVIYDEPTDVCFLNFAYSSKSAFKCFYGLLRNRCYDYVFITKQYSGNNIPGIKILEGYLVGDTLIIRRVHND